MAGHTHEAGHEGHHHHHIPDSRGALLAVLGLNSAFLVIELVAGLWTGSLALLSDAAHMTSDVAALVLAVVAAQVARRPATYQSTFGLQRAEVLGAFVNGVALLIVVGGIVVEAAHRLWEGPQAVAPWPVLLVGAAGLVINVGSAVVLLRADRENLNIQGALWHMVADALGSLGAVLAAMLLMLGVPAADPVVSVVIALLAGWGAWRVTAASGRVLLQLPPRAFDVHALQHTLEGVEGVRGVHDLHVWSVDGQRPIVTAHLATDRMDEAGRITVAALAAAEAHHGVHHATFQIEAEAEGPCPHGDCGPRHGAHGHAPHDHGHDAHHDPHHAHA